ncbi:hypothetical protein [Hypericibacter sp.]|uniref:hypothetical protein n=1 Tax=Hypericibacter sp. TaxID=2705401 RepID=UPI003D6CDB62
MTSVLEIPFVAAIVWSSSLVPATACLLLNSYRRWLALGFCAAPPVSAFMIRRSEDAPFLLVGCAMLIMATLLLVVFDRRFLLQRRSHYLSAGVGLMLAASILPILAVLAAADHNPQGEFCLGDNFTSDCDWDYLKLSMIGVIGWGTIQSLVFFFAGEVFLIGLLIRRRKSAKAIEP